MKSDIKEEKPNNWLHEILGAVTVSMIPGLYGYVAAYATVAIPYIGLDENEASWFASLEYFFIFFFTPLGGKIADIFGKKIMVSVLSSILAAGWILIGVSESKMILFLGRILSSAACATMLALPSVYIAEIAHPDSRKALLSITSLFMNFEMSLPWIMGSFLTWREIAGIASVPSFLLALVIFSLPESPYYLIEQGKEEQAKKSLQYYRNKNYDVSSEISEIKAKSIEKKLKNQSFSHKSFRAIFSPSFYKPFVCIGILYSIDMCTGVWAASVNMQEIFEESGMTYEPKYCITVIGIVRMITSNNYEPKYCITVIGIVRMITSMIAPLFVEKLDSKQSYVIGAALKAICTSTIGLYFHFMRDIEEFNIIPFVMLLVVGSILQPLLILPVLYSLIGELFPTEIRTFSVGITEAIYYVFAAIFIKFFPQMKSTMGLVGVFYTYAAFATFGTIWGYLTIPDNRSKTLIEIEESFEEKKEFQLSKYKDYGKLNNN